MGARHFLGQKNGKGETVFPLNGYSKVHSSSKSFGKRRSLPFRGEMANAMKVTLAYILYLSAHLAFCRAVRMPTAVELNSVHFLETTYKQ